MSEEEWDIRQAGCEVPAAEVGAYTGCDLPIDAELTALGWQWRCNTDEMRLRDIVDTYESLGFEVRLEPLDLDGLSENCDACAPLLRQVSAVYVRKKG
ncbi:MAG: hypothetical protein QF578_23560 [Alphaproteobacteria bacterium]|jgi:hypothetical protein|nr:hypothetical protein [Alphaproteobacteria bacterium]MDP6567823.1 hypothetical protein [Alphaproteobacteria bacterium]MDP6815504.1 hypothetical protein [Alphaproteobacteria bacterium]